MAERPGQSEEVDDLIKEDAETEMPDVVSTEAGYHTQDIETVSEEKQMCRWGIKYTM